jgi:hypothetical protein
MFLSGAFLLVLLFQPRTEGLHSKGKEFRVEKKGGASTFKPASYLEEGEDLAYESQWPSDAFEEGGESKVYTSRTP